MGRVPTANEIEVYYKDRVEQLEDETVRLREEIEQLKTQVVTSASSSSSSGQVAMNEEDIENLVDYGLKMKELVEDLESEIEQLKGALNAANRLIGELTERRSTETQG